MCKLNHLFATFPSHRLLNVTHTNTKVACFSLACIITYSQMKTQVFCLSMNVKSHATMGAFNLVCKNAVLFIKVNVMIHKSSLIFLNKIVQEVVFCDLYVAKPCLKIGKRTWSPH